MGAFRKKMANLRGLRAIAAVSLLIALVAAFFFEQRAREELRLATLETAMGMNWRLNDVIVEALIAHNHLDHYVHATDVSATERRAQYQAVQLHYELLWSNVEIAKRTDLRLYDSFNEPLMALEAYLVEIEGMMFGAAPPPLSALEVASRTILDFGMNLQRAWQNTQYFGVRMFIGREEEQLAQMQATIRERIVLLLILALTLFLVVEAYRVGNMRRAEARLKAEAKSAALASEAKSVFLANVSHEIRTPLNGILGMASELKESDLDEDQRSCLQVIAHAGDVLLHTLNDVLDLSKVEAGQLELETRVFDLHALLASAMGLYRARAQEKGLSLVLERDDLVPDWVEGDGQRISQVLHNLIGNAIKFTDAGTVTLRVSEGDLPGTIRFAVTDTGTGIDPTVHAKVFEPFSQADNSITRTKGGTGLGLSISRGLCSAMGGQLALESELGHGATFWFELPLPERTRASSEPEPETGGVATLCQTACQTAPPEILSNRRNETSKAGETDSRILIVDDNATNRLLLRRYLRNLEVNLTEACDGAQALAAVQQQSYDVVLMDVQMPVMDGIAATQAIRAYEREHGCRPVKIIAITANVMTHQVEGYLQSGVDAVLGKPVSKAALLECLKKNSRSAA